MHFTQSARTVFLPPLLYRPFQETYGCETFQFGRYNIPDLKTYNILLDPLYTLMFGIENWEGWRKSHLIFPFWNTSLKIERYIFECSKHIYCKNLDISCVQCKKLIFFYQVFKDDVLSFYITLRRLSRDRVILFLVLRQSAIRANGQ